MATANGKFWFSLLLPIGVAMFSAGAGSFATFKVMDWRVTNLEKQAEKSDLDKRLTMLETQWSAIQPRLSDDTFRDWTVFRADTERGINDLENRVDNLWNFVTQPRPRSVAQ